MNCRHFQDQLYEYVEGSLSAGDQAAAEQHLAGCDACRQAVRNEQRLTRSLSGVLRQKTESLTLAPDIQRHILAAARRPSVSPMFADFLADLWHRPALAAAMIMALVLIMALATVDHFSRHWIKKQNQGIAATQAPGVFLPHLAPSVSIHVSSSAPTYLFRMEGDHVIDNVSYQTVAASETLPSFDQTPHLKTLL